MLELFQIEWCPASRRVREHLTELGVDYLIHQVPVENEELTTIAAEVKALLAGVVERAATGAVAVRASKS